MVLPGETYFQALDPYPHVSTGIPFAEACKHHASETFGAQRIYIIVSKSISTTENFTTLQNALEGKVVGVRYGIRQHVPWTDVLEVVADLRDLQADLVVTLGAGSLTDAAKVAILAAANDAFTVDALAELRYNVGGKDAKAATIPTINIPTSLAGGEYNAAGGATDWRNHQKAHFQHPSLVAKLVILDPALTVSTPEKVWISSGVRAVDHCVEGLCSRIFRPGSDEDLDREKIEKTLSNGLKRLLPGLLTTKKHPKNLEARRGDMLGALDAMIGLLFGAVVGASHGIGHQLGPLGVGHGETSCVMLATVLDWNLRNGEAWVAERQKLVLTLFWGDATVAEMLRAHRLSEDTASAGDVVAAYVKALGMPTSLMDVGIGEESLDKLAENSMTDRNIASNPVRIDKAEQVREILQLALGK